MPYSDWQLRRLRHRLEAYRVWRKRKHGLKSWEDIASDIVNEDAVAAMMALPQEDPIKALGESLRRFGKDVQTPEEGRLRAIQKFLELRGFLSAIDLKEDMEPHHAAFALNGFLGVSDKINPEIFENLEGVYRAITLSPRMITETALALNLSRADMVLEATEIKTTYRDPQTQPFKTWLERERKAHKLSAIERTGWVALKPGGVFIAFLRDARDGEVLCYTALSLSNLRGANASLALLRMEQGFVEWWQDPVNEDITADQLFADKLKPNLLLFSRELYRATTLS